jgi:phosphoribosylaminoimidazolecarboxamide formyltransferase/IMP cyclohydrolase
MTNTSSLRPVARALLSVSDKSGLVDLGRGLSELGIELIASGGTAKALSAAGLNVLEVADLTKSPEILGGRVKTLHPKIHGGILAMRGNKEHEADMEANGIKGIDLVIVNLYPFEETVANPDVTLPEAIEKIDIGGPSMIRSAAKNQKDVAVLVDPSDYSSVLEELSGNSCSLTAETRAMLAVKAFQRTSAYDTAIHAYLAKQGVNADDVLPVSIDVDFPREAEMRYGENPHQRAALYGNFLDVVTPLHGKELSFNNVVDVQAALELILEFDPAEDTACAILKHNTPCGAGRGQTAEQAYRNAFDTDPDSPFGGIIAINTPFDVGIAKAVDEIFTEVLIAPSFSDEALALLKKKKNRRLLTFDATKIDRTQLNWKRVFGGVLVQEPDLALESMSSAQVVTKRKPTDDELRALAFAWTLVKHVKSNAVVFAGPDRTLAVGGGSTSRVDAVHNAREKAARVGNDLQGSALGSDAFFPFPDGLQLAVAAGATAIVQPGGSVRDEDVIKAADELGIAMVFTGARHFKH